MTLKLLACWIGAVEYTQTYTVRYLRNSGACASTSFTKRVKYCILRALVGLAVLAPLICEPVPLNRTLATLFTYTLAHEGDAKAYDEALAAACLQGIINRESPQLYLLSGKNSRPHYWLDLLSAKGRWLEQRELKPLPDLNALVKLAGARLRGAVIWDPAVPATVNVATTIAGVEDGVVLSPEFANRYVSRWGLKVLVDLRGRFTGAETGSPKNDAYRWAIREYLAKGRCSPHRLCLFEDPFSTRSRGDLGYVVTRDWSVYNRAFVFDLSPWGDEPPADDTAQRAGLDLETYKMILRQTLRQSAGKQMTEVAGFFVFSKYSNVPGHKSAHEPVPTEWETVWLITPYNCYQNTVASDCFNQSFHSQAPRRPLQQHPAIKTVPLQKKNYICILMADYDSALPLYDFLPKYWSSTERGKIPLAWGVNPNLLETYPDLIACFYQTASPADTFTSDASAAGYMNPNRIRKEYLPLFVRHNRRFFHEADMIAGPEQTAQVMARAITARGGRAPGFYFFRIVWVSPTDISATLTALRRKRTDVEVVDPHTFFALFKQSQQTRDKGSLPPSGK